MHSAFDIITFSLLIACTVLLLLMFLLSIRRSRYEKAHLERELSYMTGELRIIAEVNKAIVRSGSLEYILGIAANSIQKLLGGFSIIFVFDGRMENVEIKAASGENAYRMLNYRVYVSQSKLAQKLIKEKQPFVIDNFQSYQESHHYRDAGFDFKPLACVPISIGDKILGGVCASDTAEKQYAERDIEIIKIISMQISVAMENLNMLKDIKDAYFNTLKALALAVDNRDSYTSKHMEVSAQYAESIARALRLEEDRIELVKYGAMLHDLGKIGIDDSVLHKKDRLTPEEYEIIKKHTVIGAKILEPIDWFKEVAYLIEHHHEHYDGSGYPHGIAGENIPLEARIITAVDSYHAMISDRPYRKAISKFAAIEELKKGSGTQFDPEVVDAFIKILTNNGK